MTSHFFNSLSRYSLNKSIDELALDEDTIKQPSEEEKIYKDTIASVKKEQ